MRTTMMAALLLAACGSTMMPAGKGSDGSDTGSDMGSDTGPMTCSSAADCASGQACDLAQHMCVAAAFTLDKAGFIDDGTRWWTSASNPTLHGTLDNPGADALTALIDNMPVGTATITGTTWSIALPDNAIAEADTRVVLRMGNLEQSQLFALDDQAPAAMLFGSVHDERGDQIDFSTGEAVHTHAGASIDLAGTGCPAVYKYAYLMDQTAPTYGREVAPNPLAWQIKVSDATPLDSMDSAYRVRDASGRVLYDWTSVSPDGTGVYTVSLFRNLIPQLGTETGQMHLDVRFRDSFGNESTTSACWENHPMAPPVEVQPAQPATLFGWTLAADSPISQLMIYTPGVEVYTQRIVQHAGEPVTVQIDAAEAAVSYTRVASDHWAITGTGTMTFTCTVDSCGPATPTDPADVTNSGTLASGQAFWSARLVDEATGNVVATGGAANFTATLPARADGTAPHAYRLEVNLGVLGVITPPKKTVLEGVSIGEYNVNGEIYTGWDPQPGPSVCYMKRCHVSSTTGQTICGCSSINTYTEVRAVKSLTLSFGAFDEQLATGISENALVPADYAAANLAIAAKTWNAGTDVLPQ
jgi:hypothetical protein